MRVRHNNKAAFQIDNGACTVVRFEQNKCKTGELCDITLVVEDDIGYQEISPRHARLLGEWLIRAAERAEGNNARIQ